VIVSWFLKKGKNLELKNTQYWVFFKKPHPSLSSRRGRSSSGRLELLVLSDCRVGVDSEILVPLEPLSTSAGVTRKVSLYIVWGGSVH
jgi:hypothetical protein